MLPPAPGMDSTMTGWPKLSPMRWAMMRAKISALPMIDMIVRIGLAGHCCAPALAAAPSSASPAQKLQSRITLSSSLAVSPKAGAGHASHLPRLFVDMLAATAVLDPHPVRRAHVEREHEIVGVAPDMAVHRDAC